MQNRKRDTDLQNSLLDSVGEGEGGMLQENSIETCILSRVERITSPGWMQLSVFYSHIGFLNVSDSKEICLQCERSKFDPWVGKIPWRRGWRPIPVFLPGEFHGQRSWWGHKESDMTEQLALSLYTHSGTLRLCPF